ncbi:MAG: sugar phosphate isomerase/epimerase [Verrucomicrobia bacterium]|nr:sugar phosphate isomerase/epimerase [Verrucomicrobiota bacterium]
MNRRQFLASAPAAALAAPALALPQAAARPRLGIDINSYGTRFGGRAKSEKFPAFKSALDVLDHCRELGAGGLQIGVRGWQADFAGKVRAKREAHGLYIEGQIGLPRTDAEVARFESELRAAKEAGAAVCRTVCLGGRRYETFDSAQAWDDFCKQSWASLTLAEPVVRRAGIKLAVENHKDWRVAEMLDLLTRLGSDRVGVNLDFGNSLSLLEHPDDTIAALAPLSFTTHVKDMAATEYEQGFLLSEVPLGQGLTNLPRAIELCRRANPAIHFNLEMITRDPLKVPCLGAKYWATLGATPARDLANTLALVKASPPKSPLPQMTGRSDEEKLAFEEENVRQSFVYAQQTLAL